MKIKCVIVDDEPLAIRVIEKHIEKLSEFELIARCKNAVEAFEILKNQAIDLIFLDIQMPELTGLEFLKTLNNPPTVVITTAYRNYAVDAFDLDVLDYLVKPVSFERFLKSVNKYYLQNSSKQISAEKLAVSDADNSKFLDIRKGKTMLRVLLSDIEYIESFRDNVVIHTKMSSYTTKNQIGRLEEKLPVGKFLRVHKSYIISIKDIKSISPTNITLLNKDIPVGRSYKSFVMEKLGYK